MSSLEAIVRQLRSAAARARAARYAVHGLVGVVAWVAAVFLAARITPFEQRAEVALLGLPIALVLAAIAWAIRRPTAAAMMAIADVRLNLKERLSTAWERRGEAGPMDAALQRDALQHAATAQLRSAFPIRVNRGEASIVAILAIFSLALALLPNPMDQVLAQRKADRASQAAAAKTVQDTQKKVESGQASPKDAEIQKILQDTQTKIRQADSPRKALESITPAEQSLNRLSDPGTPALRSNAQNLANALSSTTAGRSVGQSLSSSPAKGAQSVRDLASQLQNLSPKDRQELAQALAKASQQSQNSQMRDSLSKASSALQSGDTAAAAQALNDTAGQLDSLQQQENTDQAVAEAINGLESAREELAAQADRDANGQGTTGTGASSSPGASPGASGSGNGSGNTGNGNGNGNGNGTGTGTGNGSNGNGTGNGTGNGNGSGGTGGTGSSGSGTGTGSGASSTERIYVPGQPVPGQTENEPTPLGPGQDVPLSPYTQVIQAYQQAALDATDQSLIPGSERDLVRQYFSQLGEQSQGGS